MAAFSFIMLDGGNRPALRQKPRDITSIDFLRHARRVTARSAGVPIRANPIRQIDHYILQNAR